MNAFWLSGLLIAAGVILSACEGEQSDAEKLAESTEWARDYQPYLQEALEAETQLLCKPLVATFYDNVSHSPVWMERDSLNSNGKKMMALLRGAYGLGLDPHNYHLKQVDSLLKLPSDVVSKAGAIDIRLTDAWFAMAAHIHKGQLDPATGNRIVPADSLPGNPAEELAAQLNDGDLTQALLAYEPDNVHYRTLRKACQQFVQTYPLHDSALTVGAYKGDSVATYNKAREALILYGFADSAIRKNDSAFIGKLKAFQEFHALGHDGKIGHNTSRALSMSNRQRWQQIALNLEKWRWHKPFPATRIFVNIPEFHLYFYRNDSLIRKHRVVTGAPTTQTPEFEAKLTYLNVYPYWHVPHSISTKEILPYVKNDPAYLARNGYSIMSLSGGDVMDVSSIDLSKCNVNYFPYRIRQNYGYGNALGVIAFMFPNKHDVFIHDTPLKFYFGTATRAYSHGCIRCQNPLALAKEVLKTDRNKIEPDTLQAIVDRRIPQMVYLKERIPIYIEYHTATTDSSGNLLLPIDVYYRDTSWTRKLFRN
jgi:murein L,D-transpeptidase YcbB/YkuD